HRLLVLEIGCQHRHAVVIERHRRRRRRAADQRDCGDAGEFQGLTGIAAISLVGAVGAPPTSEIAAMPVSPWNSMPAVVSLRIGADLSSVIMATIRRGLSRLIE